MWHVPREVFSSLILEGFRTRNENKFKIALNEFFLLAHIYCAFLGLSSFNLSCSFPLFSLRLRPGPGDTDIDTHSGLMVDAHQIWSQAMGEEQPFDPLGAHDLKMTWSHEFFCSFAL